MGNKIPGCIFSTLWWDIFGINIYEWLVENRNIWRLHSSQLFAIGICIFDTATNIYIAIVFCKIKLLTLFCTKSYRKKISVHTMQEKWQRCQNRLLNCEIICFVIHVKSYLHIYLCWKKERSWLSKWNPFYLKLQAVSIMTHLLGVQLVDHDIYKQ